MPLVIEKKKTTKFGKGRSHVSLSRENPKYHYHVRNSTKDGKSPVWWFSYRIQGWDESQCAQLMVPGEMGGGGAAYRGQ